MKTPARTLWKIAYRNSRADENNYIFPGMENMRREHDMRMRFAMLPDNDPLAMPARQYYATAAMRRIVGCPRRRTQG